MCFASCVAQGLERDPFLLPALRRAPKDTLFCFLRCAGPRKRPFLPPALRRAPKDTLFCLLRCAGLRKRPFFASCVAQGSKRHPFLLPALRRAPKDVLFQLGTNKKSVQTVTARTLPSMLSLKSKISYAGCFLVSTYLSAFSAALAPSSPTTIKLSPSTKSLRKLSASAPSSVMMPLAASQVKVPAASL